MRYEAEVQAFDMFDQVHVSAVVYSTRPGPDYTREPEAMITGFLPGTGESDPREWLRDVLVALIERT